MDDIAVTGLSLVLTPKPNKSGDSVLAWFDCKTSEVELYGCALVRQPGGRLKVWAPKLDAVDSGARRGVNFCNRELPATLVVKALAAYRALGGAHGE
ncbi:hypothetical protein FHP25_13280 [Vineibacter terrae]|uniref:Uncharacterized protein n=1 Tax=Vineibacter terrae TaxID=2586908 RepID=A0A5C8PP48_9HYPH|nr:hypothetical protein [Vineibacter terrae]TXL75622.1 hypothetical protein FHP25_13280 [Vineibacter terrae]